MPITPEHMLEKAHLSGLVSNLHDVGFIRWSDEPFLLKSGIRSNVYVYGREDLTDNPLVLRNLGAVMADYLIDHIDVPDRQRLCLIGIPTAGTSLAQATSSGSDGRIIFRIMREMQKSYGAHKKTVVNGRPDASHFYATIDNVITDGASKIEAANLLREDGYPADEIIHVVLVDRGNGGVEKLREAGLKVEVIFSLLDIASVFVSLGLWTQEQYSALEIEIKAHQV